jgi:hypothetical protein
MLTHLRAVSCLHALLNWCSANNMVVPSIPLHEVCTQVGVGTLRMMYCNLIEQRLVRHPYALPYGLPTALDLPRLDIDTQAFVDIEHFHDEEGAKIKVHVGGTVELEGGMEQLRIISVPQGYSGTYGLVFLYVIVLCILVACGLSRARWVPGQ